MPQLKKILVALPEDLIGRFDTMANGRGVSRSQLIREALMAFIKEDRKKQLRQTMKQGYLEMAKINQKIAEECFEADNRQLCVYEEKLAECE